MSKSPRYEGLSITDHALSASGILINPGSEAAKVVFRSTGAFDLASQAVGGVPTAAMEIPSGIAFEYEGGAPIIVSAPKAARLKVLKYT